MAGIEKVTKKEEKPCCAADALRRIRQVNVNGIPTGITMLDESISEVREAGLTNEREAREALMKQIRIYNYFPPGVQEAYTESIMREYHANRKNG